MKSSYELKNKKIYNQGKGKPIKILNIQKQYHVFAKFLLFHEVYSESFVFSGKRDRPVTICSTSLRFVLSRSGPFHFVPVRSGPFEPSITVTVTVTVSMFIIFHCLFTMNNYTTSAVIFILNQLKENFTKINFIRIKKFYGSK